MPAQKIDWKKVVTDNSATMLFLPDGFKKAQDELDASRKKFNEEAVKMAEKEIRMNVANNDFFLELRIYLAKNGYPDIWVKQIGFNSEAIKEGVYIVNILENQR